MTISVVVLGYNNKDLSVECLKSVMASNRPADQVIFVDNGSEDGSAGAVNKIFPSADIVRLEERCSVARGFNYGIARARGDIIFVLANDTVIREDCLKEICSAMEDTTVDCAAAKLLRYGTNRIDTFIQRMGFLGVFPYSVDFDKEDRGQCDGLPTDFVAGTAVVLRRSILEEIAMKVFPLQVFDENYRLFWSDVDLSFRLRKYGKKVITIPKAVVWHRGGATLGKTPIRSKLDMNINRLRFFLEYLGSRV